MAVESINQALIILCRGLPFIFVFLPRWAIRNWRIADIMVCYVDLLREWAQKLALDFYEISGMQEYSTLGSLYIIYVQIDMLIHIQDYGAVPAWALLGGHFRRAIDNLEALLAHNAVL